MTNHKIGLSQAQQRRNHRHVMWRVLLKKADLIWTAGAIGGIRIQIGLQKDEHTKPS